MTNPSPVIHVLNKAVKNAFAGINFSDAIKVMLLTEMPDIGALIALDSVADIRDLEIDAGGGYDTDGFTITPTLTVTTHDNQDGTETLRTVYGCTVATIANATLVTAAAAIYHVGNSDANSKVLALLDFDQELSPNAEALEISFANDIVFFVDVDTVTTPAPP